ncbi:MAG: serine hydrolase domain-containing protein, partial [Bacteroidota bacterium]|nr:serine hydrolase domain-containing protein [Bacteroidota bacterium]
MKEFVVVIPLSLLICFHAFSQSLNVKKLDSLFNILDSHGLATGSLAVSINGEPVYERAIGFAMLEGDKKISTDINTRYRIGSVSKMFTAVMIFQLIDEKKLDLNEKLATFFPGLPN